MKHSMLLAVCVLVCSLIPLDLLHASTPLEYSFEGQLYESQLIQPDEAISTGAAVLIFPQWMGISKHELEWGQRLADLGYTVLVADLYGKGNRASNREEAAGFARPFYQDETRSMMRGRATAALEQLQMQPGVDQDRIFAIGFCFGGACSLELARTGASLAGAVSFHGNLTTPQPAGSGDVKAPLLVCHGGIDPHVGWEQVTGFRDEMNASGADFRLIVYSDAVHAFTQEHAGNDPSTGAAYNERAANDSWKQMIRFFEENL